MINWTDGMSLAKAMEILADTREAVARRLAALDDVLASLQRLKELETGEPPPVEPLTSDQGIAR